MNEITAGKIKPSISCIPMRDAFFDKLYNIALQDKRVMLLSGDFGAQSLDKFKKDLRGQYINMGVTEQNMVSVAAGLASGGKIVYIYSIAPFVTLRCYEQVRIDLCCMNLPVTCLGVGTGYSYSAAGPTHHAVEDIAVMRTLPKMMILNPSDNNMAAAFAEITYKNPGPKYVRFDREVPPLIYSQNIEFSEGLAIFETGRDITLITTGTMVHQAFKVRDNLHKHSMDTGIIDLYRIKPINEKLLLKVIEKSKRIITIEENFLNGGIGSIVAEILVDNDKILPLKRIAIQDEYCFKFGSREYLRLCCGLDVDSITKTILGWLR